MLVEPTAIPDVRLVAPKRFADKRGFFVETYNRRALETAGIDLEIKQVNLSRSDRPGTIRGLHFQGPPCEQGKLVRCSRGAIFDVAVDLRRSSPTYGRHAAATLSAENGLQMFVPRGFAHGFCTLEPETEVIYEVDAYYAPQHDLGLRWDDADLGIPWPLAGIAPILSDKDRELPLFRAFVSPFE